MTAESATPRDASMDGRMIDDLRSWRATVGFRKDQAIIGIEELDALLAAADERDRLKREACEEPTTITARRGDTVRVSTDAEGNTIGVVLAFDSTMTVERAEPADDMLIAKCRYCGESITRPLNAANWNHVGLDPARGPRGYHGAMPAREKPEAVCACGGPLTSLGGVWRHTSPDAPRDCIALPHDHPSRAKPAPRMVYPCAVCSRAIYERAPQPTDLVGQKHYEHLDADQGTTFFHAAERA